MDTYFCLDFYDGGIQIWLLLRRLRPPLIRKYQMPVIIWQQIGKLIKIQLTQNGWGSCMSETGIHYIGKMGPPLCQHQRSWAYQRGVCENELEGCEMWCLCPMKLGWLWHHYVVAVVIHKLFLIHLPKLYKTVTIISFLCQRKQKHKNWVSGRVFVL